MKTKIFILLSLLTTLAACSTTSGGLAMVNKYQGNWQGWDSVLQIAQEAMTSADGIPLVDIADMQARADGEPHIAELTEEQQLKIAEAQANSEYPSFSVATGDILLTIFANGQLYNTRIENLPIDTYGAPTASSASKIFNAAALIKQQAFDQDVILVPKTAIPDVNGDGIAIAQNTVTVSNDTLEDSNSSYQNDEEPVVEPPTEQLTPVVVPTHTVQTSTTEVQTPASVQNQVQIQPQVQVSYETTSTITIIDSSSIPFMTEGEVIQQ